MEIETDRLVLITITLTDLEDIHKLHKVEAGADTENIASIKVLEKSGMVREGLRRNKWLLNSQI